jgi:peptide/nickel transport system permease protein
MLTFLRGSVTLRLIIHRLLQSIPVMLGVTFFTFCLLNLLPGDTAEALLGDSATPKLIQALNVRLHLNQPFFDRYWHWLVPALHGNFGISLANDEAVSTVLKSRLPVSLELIGLAFVISIVFSIPVAALAAYRPKSIVDRLSLGLTGFGLSVPNFVYALVLILIFAVHEHIFPAYGFVPISAGLFENVRSLLMPSGTIAFGLFCGYTRVLRGDMVDQIANEDYIMTARAKGVRPWQILIRHALRNSLFGLITLIGLNLGTLIGGTVIVEQIYALPGIGQELLASINNRDVVVVEAIVAIIAVAVVLSNLVVDLLYSVLDPRIRYGSRAS